MTIEEFAKLVHTDTVAWYNQEYPDYPKNCLDINAKVTIKPGKKYTKIDVGRSGKLMVVNDTGEIFGIKAYGVIHRGHPYGTLNTVDDWYWGEYHPCKTD